MLSALNQQRDLVIVQLMERCVFDDTFTHDVSRATHVVAWIINQLHRNVKPQAAREEAREMLKQAGIPSPDERLKAYPHQFSGGMRQRVAIAIALLNKPKLIIANEPRTALDVTSQGQIFYEVQRLCEKTGIALIWITHDLAAVAGLAYKICVMYEGLVVESGSVDAVFDAPQHPDTHGLIRSMPHPNKHGQQLQKIPGMTPSLLILTPGCAFRARCEYASGECMTAPDIIESEAGRLLQIPTVVGIVGESGCGKSTLGRVVAGVREPSEGQVRFRRRTYDELTGTARRDAALKVQMTFQDPMSSLNPSMRVADIVGEAPLVHGLVGRRNIDSYLSDELERVGLDASYTRRYPHQFFSGGQRPAP